ncbi:hypothetical protein C8F01DRAFT_1271116 [Mycena amicta]|nr:hypothetical protein C8F01DRAFT_1271116 [Mycena amicta]
MFPRLLQKAAYQRVPPRREFALLAFLTESATADKTLGILSVFSWGIGSGLVCIEVLWHILTKWPHADRIPPDPLQRDLFLQSRRVCLAEKRRLLFPPTFLDPSAPAVTGSASADTNYTMAISCLSKIPRIVFDKVLEDGWKKRTPQRLVLPNTYNQLFCMGDFQVRNQIAVWSKQIFGKGSHFGGLEAIQVKQWRYQTPTYERNTIPTEEELDMFCQSPGHELNVPFTGHACTLQEGDHVVLAQDQAYWDAPTGIIVRIRWVSRDDGKLHRMAVILHAYDGVSEVDGDSPELKNGWIAPCGDLVRIIRGPHKGKTGFVVKVHMGGWATFYQAEQQNGKLALCPEGLLQREEQPLLRTPNPDEMQIDDLELNMEDEAAYEQLAPFSKDNSESEDFRHAGPDRREDLCGELELKCKKCRREMKDGARWIEGMEVQVVGKHPFKGLRGVVRGYWWLAPGPQARFRANYNEIELHINLDLRRSMETVPYKSVVELSLPLKQAVYITDAQGFLIFEPRPRPPSPLPPPRPITPHPPPSFKVYGEPPSIDKIGGHWLLGDKFLQKQIDVQVVDAAGATEEDVIQDGASNGTGETD